MDDDKAIEITVATIVVFLVAFIYWTRVGTEGLLYFFTSRWWLFMSNSFLIWPVIEIFMNGFKGLKENWQSTTAIVMIGAVFVFLYMVVTQSTVNMTFERSLEYVLYALPISYFAGRVKQSIMEGIR